MHYKHYKYLQNTKSHFFLQLQNKQRAKNKLFFFFTRFSYTVKGELIKSEMFFNI